MKKAIITILIIVAVLALLIGAYFFFWTADNFATLGDKAMDSAHYARAVWFYQKAVDLDPSEPDYVLSLADACIADGSYTRAERALVSAIRVSPDVSLYCRLSAVYVEQDKLFDAQEMLDNLTDPSMRARLDALRPAAPVFSPEPDSYDDYISVSISGSGKVYYSMTDDFPSTETGAYDAPVTLASGESNFTAVTVADNGLVSACAQAQYLVVGVVEEMQFTDPAMEAYLRETTLRLGTTPILTSDLWTLSELTLPEGVTDLSDLRSIASAAKITSLTITNNNEITDFSPIGALTELTSLTLDGCAVTDDALSVIATLPELRELHLRSCAVSTLLPLVDANRIEVLDLSGNSITDISPLSKFTALTDLDLSGNSIAVIDALSEAKKLRNLNLSQNDLTTIDPLLDCSEMLTLDASYNKLDSLGALKYMTKLTDLNVSHNQIKYLSGLYSCTALERLDLSYNELYILTPVRSMVSLHQLDVSHNHLSELPEFDRNMQLQQFYASYNQLEDISTLAGLAQLAYVDVDYNEKVADIECLADCPLIVQVNAFGTAVTRVSKLTEMSVIVNFTPTPGIETPTEPVTEPSTEAPTEA